MKHCRVYEYPVEHAKWLSKIWRKPVFNCSQCGDLLTSRLYILRGEVRRAYCSTLCAESRFEQLRDVAVATEALNA